MMALTNRGAPSGSSPSFMPALLCVVASILLWLAAEDAREKLPPLQGQITAAQTLSLRAQSAQGNEAQLKQLAQLAQQERTAIEKRLLTAEAPQLVRAKMVYDLRQRCAATLAQNCSVRLSEDTIASTTLAAVGSKGPARAPSLDDLGIVKSRATVSASFQKDELAQMANSLSADPSAHWRINGLTVKGNVFELDVERHMRQAPAAASSSAPASASSARPARQP
jgi:hypothetical protein